MTASTLDKPKTDDEPDTRLDDDETETTPSPDPDGKALFDRSAYEREDLQIQKVDGQAIDKIRIDFSGSIMLDRSDPADVALFNAAILSKELELRCAGKVSRVGTGYTTSKEGDLDAVVGTRTIKVDTVYILDATAL